MTDKDIRYETFRKAIDTWGYTAQFHMAIEECSELIQAICKLDRAVETNKDFASSKIIEEIADVEIMLDQLKIMLACSERCDEVYKHKLERLRKRLGI